MRTWSRLLPLVFLLVACGPWGRIPGGRVHGEQVSERIADWRFTDVEQLAVVETRPVFPHSVTTVLFTHEGALYIPSAEPRSKRWPRFVLEDPSVRIEIAGKVYAGELVREEDPGKLEALIAAVRAKYPRLAASATEQPDREVWFFRFEQG